MNADRRKETKFSIAFGAGAAPSRMADPPFSNTANSYLFGLALVACSYMLFVSALYSLLLSKLFPQFHNPVLQLIREDWYYCMLLPSLVPTTIFFVYINWVSMKFFRHA